jgi:hypothetical protein
MPSTKNAVLTIQDYELAEDAVLRLKQAQADGRLSCWDVHHEKGIAIIILDDPRAYNRIINSLTEDITGATILAVNAMPALCLAGEPTAPNFADDVVGRVRALMARSVPSGINYRGFALPWLWVTAFNHSNETPSLKMGARADLDNEALANLAVELYRRLEFPFKWLVRGEFIHVDACITSDIISKQIADAANPPRALPTFMGGLAEICIKLADEVSGWGPDVELPEGVHVYKDSTDTIPAGSIVVNRPGLKIIYTPNKQTAST